MPQPHHSYRSSFCNVTRFISVQNCTLHQDLVLMVGELDTKLLHHNPKILRAWTLWWPIYDWKWCLYAPKQMEAFFLSGFLTSLGSLPLLVCSHFTTKPRDELFWWFSNISFHKTFHHSGFFPEHISWNWWVHSILTVINNGHFPVINPILVVSAISLGFPCLMQDNGLILFKQTNMVPLSTGWVFQHEILFTASLSLR